MNVTANETRPVLSCLSRPEEERLLGGGEWTLFVPIIGTAALMIVMFVTSVACTQRWWQRASAENV